MPDISVVTDSACDLMPDFEQARDIRVVPLTIRFGGQEFDAISAKEFWDLHGVRFPFRCRSTRNPAFLG